MRRLQKENVVGWGNCDIRANDFLFGRSQFISPGSQETQKVSTAQWEKKKEKNPADNAVMLETLAARASEHVKLIWEKKFVVSLPPAPNLPHKEHTGF